MGPGGLGAECRKEGAVSLDSLPSADGRVGGRGASQQMLCGGGESSGLGSPPPLLGSWKKSSLIGRLAVSFTLNIKVQQKSQASVCWQRRGEGLPQGLGWDRGPPLTPSLGALCLRVLCGPGESPLCWPSRGACAHHPHPDSTLQSKQINATGRGNTPAPKSQTSSSCPILFSRLKYKIQTIGEQRSRAALGSTRTRGLCTTIR